MLKILTVNHNFKSMLSSLHSKVHIETVSYYSVYKYIYIYIYIYMRVCACVCVCVFVCLCVCVYVC